MNRGTVAADQPHQSYPVCWGAELFLEIKELNHKPWSWTLASSCTQHQSPFSPSHGYNAAGHGWNFNTGTCSEAKGPLSRKTWCWRVFTLHGHAPRFSNLNLSHTSTPHTHSPNPLRVLGLTQLARWIWGTTKSPVFSVGAFWINKPFPARVLAFQSIRCTNSGSVKALRPKCSFTN